MAEPADKFPTFREFFGELYQDEQDKPFTPFPWQERLAERACRGDWPECIAVSTASGKTALIDAAVFALAAQADLGDKRTAPRRIFFVVDRRVIVDEAFDRAKCLAARLAKATSGALKQVADRLRGLTGENDGNPLECYQLRGGVYRDNAWVRTPLQPTVVCSTVDQIGSRLLFRGYGVSTLTAPIHAAMVANDSLIVLDEAHCSNPFRQTADAVRRYRGWAEESPASPFHFMVMSATPGQEFAPEKILRLDEDPANLDSGHPVLAPRLSSPKPTSLLVAAKAKGANATKEFAAFVAKEAKALVKDDVKAVGIIVNRVATARRIHHELQSDSSLRKPAKYDTVLLTGRMRPYDKDRTINEWRKRIEAKPGRPALERPVFVVSTQCLEVGANLDFDALISECASLDALRQRFGRLNRLGSPKSSPGMIVIQQSQERGSDDDPIYGKKLGETWKWLKANLSDDRIDMGIAAFDAVVERSGLDVAALCATQPDAPVMLPAYVDFWVQTAPIPRPDPDVSLFLHGMGRKAPEIQVVWRGDLDACEERQWAEVVSLCPPTVQECMPVQLHVFRRWWRGEQSESPDAADVEGTGIDEEDAREETTNGKRHGIVWRGLEKSGLLDDADKLAPGDTVVLPISAGGWDVLGYIPGVENGDSNMDIVENGDSNVDIAERVERPFPVLRVHESLNSLWGKSWPGYQQLLDVVADDDPAARSETRIRETLRRLAGEADLADNLKTLLKQLADDKRLSITAYPGREDEERWSGMVLSGSRRTAGRDGSFTDEDNTSAAGSRYVPLDRHNRAVATTALHFAEQSGLSEGLCRTIEHAGLFHDLGKADPRFQAWLFGGNRLQAEAQSRALAKSARMPRSALEYETTRRKSGYPKGGRHELLSVRLAEADGLPGDDAVERELMLHLVASHHGHCRPFAPVIADTRPEDVSVQHDGRLLSASSATGMERLDSGAAERFWRAVRRHGWWGSAYLEAILRLADWQVSADESNEETTQ